MPISAPALETEARNDLDFANVLRDCLSCAVITVDHQRTITGFNQKAEKLTHLKTGHTIGKPLDELPSPVRQVIADTLSTGKAVTDSQISLRNEKRGDLAIQISTSPIKSAGGKVSGVVAVLNDVSSARKWEANMRRLDRLHSIGTLSASMAHEVKNAFVAVRTFVDLLLEQNKQADLADVVRLEMRRIESILAQMRKFSGPAKPEFSQVHLHLLLEKSLQLIQHLLEDKKIKVSRSFSANQDSLVGDSDQLEQAFINLLFNAIDAMKPHGKLSVGTEFISALPKAGGQTREKSAPSLRITIADTGIGIPAENMDRLFEPFFTTKPDGTGLGLAITRRIIHEHHGLITVQSEVDKGTTFSLVLPANHARA